ncbi:pectate lyase [Aquiflexum sp. TKW24L]|uniref:pectate lyase family protein n=1 Tax=Aquiflexum sp. TKW24L TaxID=2942212 RepID=UPI0020BE638B|nr:pectate lyase [Aquiflexum sp. TKW24L]MCL6260787.1 pectate lyase [Aquiflexum sp. TKW24L]
MAFPGAEGFGKYATGGRGGMVYIVTNLNDSGLGSLRWAVEAKGPRTIVFEVSGNISLKSRLNVGDGNLTIAGQTAPGDGITIQNFPFRIINKSNIIIRFIRFRLGDLGNEAEDAFEARGGSNNLIIDHCSFSWGIDETCSVYDVTNTTVQYCIISEGLNDSKHPKGKHGYGSLMGGSNLSLYKNLWAHFSIRMPSMAHQGGSCLIDIRNNVIYNWGMRSSDNGSFCLANFVNNYYKPGPASFERGGFTPLHFLWPTAANKNPENYGKFYLEGNILEGKKEVNSDQWKGVRLENSENSRVYLDAVKHKDKNGGIIPMIIQKEIYSKTLTSIDALEHVLVNAGSSLSRDSIDIRVVREVRSGKTTYKGSKTGLPGIIDSQKDVGGWPTLKSSIPPKDTDRDGMPDEWEIENGLDPEKRNDRFYDLNPNFTNLEMYLNSLVEHLNIF